MNAYIDALGASAVFVQAVDGKRPSRVSQSVEKALVLVDTFWFAKPQHAELVIARARDDLDAIGALRDKGWIDMDGRELRDTVANAAAYLGAPFRPLSAIRADAEKSVDQILADVEKARLDGGLKAVNAAYKVYRQQQTEAGQKAVPYREHLAAFTRSLIIAAAQTASAMPPSSPPNLSRD